MYHCPLLAGLQKRWVWSQMLGAWIFRVEGQNFPPSASHMQNSWQPQSLHVSVIMLRNKESRIWNIVFGAHFTVAKWKQKSAVMTHSWCLPTEDQKDLWATQSERHSTLIKKKLINIMWVERYFVSPQQSLLLPDPSCVRYINPNLVTQAEIEWVLVLSVTKCKNCSLVYLFD